MDNKTYDNVRIVKHRIPGELFHRNIDNDQTRVPVCCTVRRCGLCMITLFISIGGGILGKYLIDHWSQLEQIS